MTKNKLNIKICVMNELGRETFTSLQGELNDK